MVKCLQSLAKPTVSPNQKYFWKKYHAPSLAILRQGQLRGITQTHTESLSQNVVTTFGWWKAAYLPAGSLRHIQSLEFRLEYTIPLRLLLAAKNHLPPSSLTVSTLTSKKYPWDPPGTTLNTVSTHVLILEQMGYPRGSYGVPKVYYFWYSSVELVNTHVVQLFLKMCTDRSTMILYLYNCIPIPLYLYNLVILSKHNRQQTAPLGVQEVHTYGTLVSICT